MILNETNLLYYLTGCSTAKLIYRSKEDYENGEPKKEEVSQSVAFYNIPHTFDQIEQD